MFSCWTFAANRMLLLSLVIGTLLKTLDEMLPPNSYRPPYSVLIFLAGIVR